MNANHTIPTVPQDVITIYRVSPSGYPTPLTQLAGDFDTIYDKLVNAKRNSKYDYIVLPMSENDILIRVTGVKQAHLTTTSKNSSANLTTGLTLTAKHHLEWIKCAANTPSIVQ